MMSLPNILTMSRIAAIPLIVGFLYLKSDFWSWAAFIIYALACITDYFDGYIARRMERVSALGRFLDPIADKLIVASIILVLVATHHIVGWTTLAALIILFGLKPAIRLIVSQSPNAVAVPAVAAVEARHAPALGATTPPLVGGEDTVNLIEDVTKRMNRSPQKRLEQIVEYDEVQAAAILRQWLRQDEAA